MRHALRTSEQCVGEDIVECRSNLRFGYIGARHCSLSRLITDGWLKLVQTYHVEALM